MRWNLAPRPARLILSLFALLLGFAPARAQSASVAGDWEGVYVDGRHIVLHFTAETPTLLSGTLDSPDQGAYDIPLSDVPSRKPA